MKWWNQARQFLSEVWMELKKTTWPSRREVYGTTLVVVVMVLICAVFLWGVDSILLRVVQVIYPSR